MARSFPDFGITLSPWSPSPNREWTQKQGFPPRGTPISAPTMRNSRAPLAFECRGRQSARQPQSTIPLKLPAAGEPVHFDPPPSSLSPPTPRSDFYTSLQPSSTNPLWSLAIVETSHSPTKQSSYNQKIFQANVCASSITAVITCCLKSLYDDGFVCPSTPTFPETCKLPPSEKIETL
jgi:hypothetical protein